MKKFIGLATGSLFILALILIIPQPILAFSYNDAVATDQAASEAAWNVAGGYSGFMFNHENFCEQYAVAFTGVWGSICVFFSEEEQADCQGYMWSYWYEHKYNLWC